MSEVRTMYSRQLPRFVVSLVTSISLLLFLSLLFQLLLTSQARGKEPERFVIAVLDLDMSGGVPETYTTTLTDRLRMELDHTRRFTVVERHAMNSILEEQGFQLSGCVSNECAVEVGKLLGVDRMIAGSIGRVGEAYSVILRLIDVESGIILRTRNVDCRCSIEDILSTRLREAARLIAGIDIDSLPDDRYEQPADSQESIFQSSLEDAYRHTID